MLKVTHDFTLLIVVDQVRVKIKYEIPSYIGSLTTVYRSDACYLTLRPMACVVNSYASELQTAVNEPIYNGNSYFIF